MNIKSVMHVVCIIFAAVWLFIYINSNRDKKNNDALVISNIFIAASFIIAAM